MFSFLFAWMGSLTFWCLMVPFWLIGGFYTLKILQPKSGYKWIMGEEKSYRIKGDEFEYGACILAIFIFWPVILAIILLSLFLWKMVWNIGIRSVGKLLKMFFIAVDKMTPNFKIVKKDDYDG